jgi:hypothetical protein
MPMMTMKILTTMEVHEHRTTKGSSMMIFNEKSTASLLRIYIEMETSKAIEIWIKVAANMMITPIITIVESDPIQTMNRKKAIIL